MSKSAQEATSIVRPPRDPGSLDALLTRRMAVERHFEETGHSYRHGPFYRYFEHHITRPLLKLGLHMLGLYGRGVRNALTPVVRRIPVYTRHLPPELDGFRILHLSDFHIDVNPDLAAALIPALRDLSVDVCVFTGDYRFEDRGPCEPAYPLLEEIVSAIRSRCGIYGILGNHDDSAMAHRLEEIGIRMLVNEATQVGGAKSPLWIIGVDDPFDYRCHDLEAARVGVPKDAFQVLLAHAPEIYTEAAAAGVDLYLTGHTHGGQIRLPFFGAIRQNASCPRAYTMGLWKHEDMQGYTTAGVGCSSLPVRFGCPPEIVLIELRRSENIN